jgi:peptidoglycan/LPS O-acetylase OafA/YrhL
MVNTTHAVPGMISNPSPFGERSYRPDIDGLRAIAVMFVIGFHAFPTLIPGGFIGVDVFFVISGFLISGILLDNFSLGHPNLGEFYLRRIRRIFPALIFVMLTALIAGWFVLWSDQYQQLGKHIVGGATFIVNGMLWNESGYFDAAAETKPLLHLWSLGVEEQFYILWPLLLAAAWKFQHRYRALIAGVSIISLAANLWLAQRNIAIDFYSPFTRFWELLAGSGLAWAMRRDNYPRSHVTPRMADELAIMGFLSLIISILVYDKNMPYPGWRALLPVIGTCFLIMPGEQSIINRRLLSHPWMVGLGLISYPLYLWHWPLLSFAHIMSGEAATRTVRIEMVAASFLLAALTYRFIELPIRRRGLYIKDTITLVALMAIVGLGGSLIWLNHGFSGRFPASAFPADAYNKELLDKEFEHQTRPHECSLVEALGETIQQPTCLDKKRPLLMLWGDSHAAAIYPGVHQLQQEYPFGVGYFVQGGCPPLFNLPHATFNKDCREINERLLASMPEMHPDAIMLASIYSQINSPLDNDQLVSKLAASIDIIRQAAPYAKILVVGPAPRWTDPMPAMYQHAVMFDHKVPPTRMSDHLDPKIIELEQMMKAQVLSQGATYLSQQEALCNQSGCLTRIGNGINSLTYVDQGHVSHVAAIYEMHQFAPQILAALGLASH